MFSLNTSKCIHTESSQKNCRSLSSKFLYKIFILIPSIQFQTIVGYWLVHAVSGFSIFFLEDQASTFCLGLLFSLATVYISSSQQWSVLLPTLEWPAVPRPYPRGLALPSSSWSRSLVGGGDVPSAATSATVSARFAPCLQHLKVEVWNQ